MTEPTTDDAQKWTQIIRQLCAYGPDEWENAPTTLVALRVPERVQSWFAEIRIQGQDQARFETGIFSDLVLKGLTLCITTNELLKLMDRIEQMVKDGDPKSDLAKKLKKELKRYGS